MASLRGTRTGSAAREPGELVERPPRCVPNDYKQMTAAQGDGKTFGAVRTERQSSQALATQFEGLGKGIEVVCVAGIEPSRGG